MDPVSVFRFLLFSHLILLLSAGYGYGNPDNCPQSFDCGYIGRIHFPFTKAERQDYGLMAIYGCDDPKPKTVELEENGKPFFLTNVLQPENIITVFDNDLHQLLQSKTYCEAFKNNITLLPNSRLVSFYFKYNVTLFRCNYSLNVSPPTGFRRHNCQDYDIYYYSLLTPPPNHNHVESAFSACSTIQFPVKDFADTNDLSSFLSAQMIIEEKLSDACEKCYNHMVGQCRLDSNKNFYCDTASSIGVAVLLLLTCCFKRKLHMATCGFFWRKNHQTNQIIEAFLKQHGPLPTRRYSYFEIKEVINCFKIKLGLGGYGSVYKGKLQDGRLVSVKVLSEIKGTDEEFINEVASISRTSHVNIVNLLGFCFQGYKKALVYEFMSNGSLEKFIYEENANIVDCQLNCKTLYDIAIVVARGLEYLHKGCNTRILHLDIKPHNILLDEDFCPKISDFGLAKVCTRKESIVSLLGARGTIGYIAPEVFSRNFGGVSHKSDVYSYGMMVLEMVGGRKNINIEVNRSSELYFPHWIYKRLELNQEFELKCIKNEIDKERVKKMIVVSLWCIQTDPATRPAMNKVVEMLEGRLESLQVPPKPYLSSPSRSPTHYSTQT